MYVCISTYDACKQPPSVSAANQKEKQANSPKEWKRKPSEREMAVNCAGGNQSRTHPQIYKKVYTQLVLPRSLLPPLLCLGRPGSLSYCPRSPPPTTSSRGHAVLGEPPQIRLGLLTSSRVQWDADTRQLWKTHSKPDNGFGNTTQHSKIRHERK